MYSISVFILDFYTKFPIFWYLNDFSTPSIKRDISFWSLINVLIFWHDWRYAIHAKTPSTEFVTEPSLTEFVTESFDDVLARCVTKMLRQVWQKSVTEFVDEDFWHKWRSPCMSKVRDGVRDGIFFHDTFGRDGVPYGRVTMVLLSRLVMVKLLPCISAGIGLRLVPSLILIWSCF